MVLKEVVFSKELDEYIEHEIKNICRNKLIHIRKKKAEAAEEEQKKIEIEKKK